MRHARLAGLAAGPVEPRPWRPPLLLLSTTAAATLTLALTISLSLFLSLGPLAPYEFSLWRWEAGNVTSSIFTVLGAGGEIDEAEEAERLASYFRLTSTIRAELQGEEPGSGAGWRRSPTSGPSTRTMSSASSRAT